MTDDRFDDLEAALRRELRSTSVPGDDTRADEMIAAATRAHPLEPRRTYAPLAAAAAVVLIGGGTAVVAGTDGGGGGEPAGGPAPSSSVTPSGAPRDVQTCAPGGAYCSTLQVCLDLGAQASTALPSYVGSYVPLTNGTVTQARRPAVRMERRAEEQARRRAVRMERRAAARAAASAAARREARGARASVNPATLCPPLPRPAAGSDRPRHVATRSLAVDPNASPSASK